MEVSASFLQSANDDLVSVEQAGENHGDLFAASRRAGDLRSFGDIGRHRHGKASQQLDPFGNGVHDFDLLAEMLVEQKMKLIEGRSGNLPVSLLVQVAQGHGIGEQLIQLLGHLQTDGLFEFKMQMRE